MSSEGSHDGHLDANAGREVVYCHNCSNEWYRDENGLACPYCRSDVTEIVSPENDPRQMDDASDSTSPGIPPLRFADDSDPDEADIEEHLGPHGFQFRQNTRTGADERHHDPLVMSLMSHRYQDLFRMEPPRSINDRALFPPSNPAPFVPPRIQRTTFTSGTAGGGTASVTIFSTPDFGSRGGGGSGSGSGSGRGDGQDPSNRGNMDPFQAFFSSVIRDLGPPDDTGEPGPQLGLFRSLQEILNHFSPGNAMMGDAVYSQEALDRIITQLMENHSQSNAPPGVSEEAIAKLKRKTVDKEFLGPEGKVECSICLDVMDADQEETYVDKVITYLPCKHWFHDECAVPWLKDHNSCPVCRTPIEKNERDGDNNRSESSGGGSGASGPSNSGLHDHSPPPPASASRSNSDQSRGFGSRPDNGADTPMGRAAADMVSSVSIDSQPRPSNPSQSRLNEALRSVASIQRERDYDRRDRGTASGVSYDTSRLQRRTSHSPSSPRATNLAEQGSRMRQRSPSEGDRRGNGDRGETRRQSGALSWLRDRFTGGGANGSGGN